MHIEASPWAATMENKKAESGSTEASLEVGAVAPTRCDGNNIRAHREVWTDSRDSPENDGNLLGEFKNKMSEVTPKFLTNAHLVDNRFG